MKKSGESSIRTRHFYKKSEIVLKRTISHKKRRRHTLPQIAVPSAQSGLTSLFGKGRGEPRRNNHLKLLVFSSQFLVFSFSTHNL